MMKINFLPEEENTETNTLKVSAEKQDFEATNTTITEQQFFKNPKKKGFFSFKFFLITTVILTLIGGFVFLSYKLDATENNSSMAKTLQKVNFFKSIKQFTDNIDKKIDGEENDRINILLLGIGGAGHDGANLTDTIILASIQPSTKKVAFMSVPRDLVVKTNNYGWRKINNINAYAEEVEKGSGPVKSSEAIQELFGVPVNYYVRVDFNGFQALIDDLGGIDVIVDNTFTDYKYPTKNHKYQTVAFEAGLQHMDGDTALKYSRSRHSLNANEGSDFARSKRQQKVLLAVKEKLESTNFITQPQKIGKILNDLNSNISTNLEVWQMIRLAKILDKFDPKTIISPILDDRPGGPLYSSMIDGAYVLRTKSDDYSELKNIAANVFNQESTDINGQANTDKLLFTEAIEIKNGTSIEGFASKTSQKLKKYGYIVTKVSNADNKDYQQTVIYDLTDGQKNQSLDFLIKTLNAQTIQAEPTLINSYNKKTDFIIILGSSSATITSEKNINSTPQY